MRVKPESLSEMDVRIRENIVFLLRSDRRPA
jgi:hypothetical protein